jgi:hypothetical protein
MPQWAWQNQITHVLWCGYELQDIVSASILLKQQLTGIVFTANTVVLKNSPG